MEQQQKHVFTDDCEYVIATTAEDAERRWAQAMGCSPRTLVQRQILEEDCWQPCRADQVIAIYLDASGKVCEPREGRLVKKTAAEWAREREGWLCQMN